MQWKTLPSPLHAEYNMRSTWCCFSADTGGEKFVSELAYFFFFFLLAVLVFMTPIKEDMQTLSLVCLCFLLSQRRLLFRQRDWPHLTTEEGEKRGFTHDLAITSTFLDLSHGHWPLLHNNIYWKKNMYNQHEHGKIRFTQAVGWKY